MPEYDSDRGYPQRRYWLRYKYDLTESEYIVLYNAQDGRCAICGCHPTDRLLCVDHDHRTGFVRGLLCNRCNTAIGYFLDDIGSIIAAAIYMERFEMVRETESHRKYMEQYNKDKHRAELEQTGQLAPGADDSKPDQEKVYTEMYERLGLQDYLPQVLQRLRNK